MKKNVLIALFFTLSGCLLAMLPLTAQTQAIAHLGYSASLPGNFNLKYTPNQYDSLLTNWYETNSITSYDAFVREFIELDDSQPCPIDNIPDSVYSQRLSMILSAIQLPYNNVIKQYIQVYTVRKKNLMGQILGLAQYYFPMIEQELARENIPLEFKMLPVIESALYPHAVSRVGASGLWQFMLRTGRQYGLEVNSFVDERFDIMASTRAACHFLKDLYAIYGDWTLVIAAYNCGPGNVNKALKRAPNAKNYWDIYYLLPKETRGYIPSFIAATYAYTFHKAHDITPVSPIIPLVTDTVHIQKITHFEQIASTLHIPISILRTLNPQYKLDIIPTTSEKQCILILPQQDILNFIDKEAEIYGKDTLYLKSLLNPDNFKAKLASSSSNNNKTTTQRTTTHKVKSGETLGTIARKYHTTSKAIMRANKLKNANRIAVGQRLSIP